ncbi:hypothetical protein C1924_06485 [Stenotrophomonas sp. ESTM1D_MKCIP4_1]|nr:hypothetical protein C1924_06485 [Stenotrophomonas sp. ESTM1D_MKCIP4_1]
MFTFTENSIYKGASFLLAGKGYLRPGPLWMEKCIGRSRTVQMCRFQRISVSRLLLGMVDPAQNSGERDAMVLLGAK